MLLEPSGTDVKAWWWNLYFELSIKDTIKEITTVWAFKIINFIDSNQRDPLYTSKLDKSIVQLGRHTRLHQHYTCCNCKKEGRGVEMS